MSGTLYPNVPLILLIVAVVAILIGLVSGLLIAYLNVPAFIATLGTIVCLPGLCHAAHTAALPSPTFWAVRNWAISASPPYGSGSINVFGLDIPYAILIFVVLALLSLFILKFTSLGNQIYAVGGNERAATLSGIKTKRIKLFVYMFSALLAAICSMINTSQLRAAHPAAGESWEMNANRLCRTGRHVHVRRHRHHRRHHRRRAGHQRTQRRHDDDGCFLVLAAGHPRCVVIVVAVVIDQLQASLQKKIALQLRNQ